MPAWMVGRDHGLAAHTNPAGSDLTPMIVEAGRGPGQTMGESGWIFAVERRGGYPWQEGAANRNERPLVSTTCARLLSLA